MKTKQKLRVWWIPQMPMRPFIVEVDSIEEGVKLINTLVDYDAFQYDNNIKGEYSNTGGIELFNEDEKEWMEWDIEDENLGYFDDPIEYLEALKESK